MDRKKSKRIGRSPSALRSTFHCFRRNSQPYPGDDSNIYFVIFLRCFVISFLFVICLVICFVIFLSFQFCLSCFCRFFVISVLACFFLWSFGGTFVILFAIVGHVRAIFSKIWKTIEKLPKKWQNNDNASRKNAIFATWKIVILFVIFSFWCHFLKNMDKYRQLFEKLQKNDK